MEEAGNNSLARMFGAWKAAREESFEEWCLENRGIAPKHMADGERLEAMREFEDAEAAMAAEGERAARGAEAAERGERWIAENVPPRYRGRTPRDFLTHSSLWMHVWGGGSALVIGLNGRGKTALAWTVAMAKAREGDTSTLITNAASLVDGLRLDAYTRKMNLGERISSEYGTGLRRLFIDEVDKLVGTRDDVKMLYAVIDHRYQWGLQTVVMGNGSPDEIQAVIGQSAYVRLTKDGARGWQMTGRDWRAAPGEDVK